MLKGKRILIGITGSIAAYKIAIVIRSLIKEGAEVKVIMTPMAKEFITPLTVATLSKNPILVEFYNPENGDWNSHVSLSLWADLYLIAPASANTLAKMVTGVADNLLLTTYLSARAPVMVAPAMDLDMYQHITTESNLSILKGRGVEIIEPSSGELASGLEGKGRMEEPDKIVERIRELFEREQSKESPLNGKKVLITAGPTVEKIDAVRYISNYSSGKMGYSIAKRAAARGAEVTLISGPVTESITNPRIKVIKVTTAQQMLEATQQEYSEGTEIAIFAAAVSDWRVANSLNSKMKRGESRELTLTLEQNEDIAATLGKVKRAGSLHIGFALESENSIENGKAKIESKNLDAIVVNSLADKGAAFGYDTNKITIIDKKWELYPFELKSKIEVAEDILDFVEKRVK